MALVTDVLAPRRGARSRTVFLDHTEWRTTSADVVKALGIREGFIAPEAGSKDSSTVRNRRAHENAPSGFSRIANAAPRSWSRDSPRTAIHARSSMTPSTLWYAWGCSTTSVSRR